MGKNILSPLTVLVGADHNPIGFSELVAYLHEKQLAEAEYILLNKAELLSDVESREQLAALRAHNPNAQVQAISARHGKGIEAWLATMLSTESRLNQQLEIDYESYAEAEAELGWLNARGTLAASGLFSPEAWMAKTLRDLSERLAAEQTAIAHMKMHVQTAAGAFKASVTNAEGKVSWDSRVPDVLTEQAQFILNLRAAASPSTLEEAVRLSLDNAGGEWKARCDIAHFESFSPAPPRPTYRIPIQLD
jgi:G3E family GTPase